MKNLLLIFSLFLTQTSYGEYREITIKQLKENGQGYLNEYVKIKCNKFESSTREVLLNMDGEPTTMKDLGNKKGPDLERSDPLILILLGLDLARPARNLLRFLSFDFFCYMSRNRFVTIKFH